MPTACMGMSACKLRLKVNGEWLEGKELEDYIEKRDKNYWAVVKKGMS